MKADFRENGVATSVSLAGRWGLALDRREEGLEGKWWRRRFEETVALPGSLDRQGKGDPVTVDAEWTGTIFDRSYYESEAYADYRKEGKVKVPFWLQPETRYVGPAWYQRRVRVPSEWAGGQVWLELERAHWQTRVWLDDEEVGAGESLSGPHRFRLGPLSGEREYRLTLRVDNRLAVEVGENAHSVSDHTQGNWNGVIGRIELFVTDASWLDWVEIHPEVEDRSIRVIGRIGGESGSGAVELAPRGPVGEESAALPTGRATVNEDGRFEARLSLGEGSRLWDEFGPALYELELSYAGQRWRERFGLRSFSAQGTQFCVNGKRTFLRGTLDCAAFPLTGHPPMESSEWRRIFRTIKAHGLNHVRFHSWCPPEAAFAAADELGLYLQVECATWPNSEAVLAFNAPEGIGDGKAVDGWVYREAERIVRAYGNHPSFVMLACGNEPGGPRHAAFLSEWVSHFRARDGRRLYTGAAGWPELEANQFQVIPEPRIHQWGDGLECRINGSPPSTEADYRARLAERKVPIVAHENGQWCAYPPLHDVSKYTGHLKPRNYEIFLNDLRAKGMGDQLAAFVQASGKLQALCYREEIEAALRTPGMGGFQLLGLQDFPGQGTAPVGLLDAFWEGKGYLGASEMRRFCGATTLLARLPKRVYCSGERLRAEVEVAHFGPSTLGGFEVAWRLVSELEGVVDSGRLPARDVEQGTLQRLGAVNARLERGRTPARYRLELEGRAGTVAVGNDWDVWVYPESAPVTASDSATVATDLVEAVSRAEAGEAVLLLGRREQIGSDAALGFSPIFWNTACTQGQAPHTLGLLCDPKHPALRAFPSEAHTNWQWWYALRGAFAMDLGGLPRGWRPIVQVIDDWYRNRRLALIWEARVGRGRLLVCGADLSDVEDCPVKRQLRLSLLAYLDSPAFSPPALGATQLLSAFR